MMETPPFEMIRSARRRRVAIRVLAGKVQLLAPPALPEQEAIAFLDKHLGWVHKKLHEQKAALSYSPKLYVDGEVFPYLGEDCFLQVAYAKKPAVIRREHQLFVFIRETETLEKRRQKIYQQLRAWYGERALEVFQERSCYYAQLLNVQFHSIQIRQFKRRWGSCSTKGVIQYTWQLILAPLFVLDYVVVHELSHLVHHNHSPRFWGLVESILPEYKIAKKWLKIQGYGLQIT